MAEEQKVTLTGNQLMQLIGQERQRLSQINQQISNFQNMKNELTAAKFSLGEIAKTKKGTKMLLTVGAGIYVEALIEDSTNGIVSIADNVFKQKKLDEILKQIEKRIGNVDSAIDNIAQEQARTISRVNQLENVASAGRQALKNQTRQ